jgi:hypothetical protein
MLAVLAVVQLGAGLPSAAAKDEKQARRFAADMAQRGNWREAQYRWEILASGLPEDPRILNNLAVASEALGEVEEARGYYEQAYAFSAGDERIEDNRRRFLRSLEDRSDLEPQSGEESASVQPAPAAAKPGKKKPEGKTIRVSVGIPIPPRLQLEGKETILVASFRAPDSSLLDINRELVRFLRAKFNKHTALDVLDVVPPPAIPEQALDDLLANVEFWRHLSREYKADLVVSGVVGFRREDASRYEDVDRVSPTTGQKTRRTEFVEREEFFYALDVFFVEGPTGAVLFRDRIERSVAFRGQLNDPIAAFYELSDAIALDVLAVVAPRRRVEPRLIFKN